MTMVQELAAMVVQARYEDISPAARQALKARVLDSLGCAIGALEGEPLGMIRQQLADFGGTEHCTLIGGGRTAPDRAAFYNGALVRYLDFNDAYAAKGESCHPSDNLAPVLAAAEYAGRHGRDLLCALAVAYQVQCRLSDVAPVRAKGFDHTTEGSYAAAAGVAKALELDQTKTAHAVAISGTAYNALRVTRTGALSHWKGLAYPSTAMTATHAAFLAMRGITGPLEVFEGNKGYMETIAGPFTLDWAREDLERVTATAIKKYNAELHSQSALEAVLELRQEAGFDGDDVERVEIDSFDVAHNIICGGEEGSKILVRTKEEADHSMPYMVAVAILDGQVLPEQYAAERIARADVQDLLRRVTVRPIEEYSRQFPELLPNRVSVHLRNGRVLVRAKPDYEGYPTRPMSWPAVVGKFQRLAARHADVALQGALVEAVANLETVPVASLTALLAKIGKA